ncbi:MAG TPA: low temperature requirement protein A [Solirubrobacteraceae bacterium]|nr:low temperature requirement protein A [Solirubrobacteraceae bacterium]
MSSTVSSRAPHLRAVMREGERVTSLELFFDLVFVIALTQCTALIALTPTWEGAVKGLLVLGLLWWSWVGYSWLTSVVDPEEGSVRLAMFAAMAALLVADLCVPRAFGGEAVLFVVAYAVVRVAQIALFMLASRGDLLLRRSVLGLAVGTAVGIGLLIVGALIGGGLQIGIWGLALALDALGPFLFGAEGWKLVPGHFAERHGGIIIIALGESVLAIGAGASAGLDAGIVAAAVLGMVVAAALWWAYFDVVALVAARRLAKAQGLERNEIARDSYSYLHFPMLAGIMLVAVGLKRTLAHVGDPLGLVPAAALLGGAAIYLLAHVAFRYRNVHSLNKQRLFSAVLLLALVPVETAVRPSSLATLGALAAVLSGLIAYEALRFADARERVRHAVLNEPVPD